jgi:hypothetical protein
MVTVLIFLEVNPIKYTVLYTKEQLPVIVRVVLVPFLVEKSVH